MKDIIGSLSPYIYICIIYIYVYMFIYIYMYIYIFTYLFICNRRKFRSQTSDNMNR